MVKRAGNWRLDVSLSCPPLNNHVNLGECLNLSGPQIVYLGMGENICPTYRSRSRVTMKLNNTCESHLWNVERSIKFVIIVTVDIRRLTMPGLSGCLVTTCLRCFSNIPTAKSYALGARCGRAGTSREPVEKWWLRDLWAVHLQPEFILSTRPASFSLKLLPVRVNT